MRDAPNRSGTIANGNRVGDHPDTLEDEAERRRLHHARDSVSADDDDLGAGRASYGDDLETLDRRRTEELKLIGDYDS